MTERMPGSDAFLLHMEDEHTPMHTLKVVILDPARRGRPLTLDDVGLAVGSHLGLIPRATQKVVAAPGFGSRPFWVDDPDFVLAHHLDERTLPAPGGQEELDALYGEVATAILPRDRALWSMTLVHGLAGGRQAVVVRVHHAVADGLGALHAFLAVTTDEPGAAVDVSPPPVAGTASRARLTAMAARDSRRTWRSMPSVIRATSEARSRTGARQGHPDIPRFVRFGRTSLNAYGDATRVCASSSLDLATMRAIGKATDTTVNGVLHAVVAGVIRTELAERGEDASAPTIAAFGIASDRANTDRRHGNFITPTFVHLRSDLPDPRARLTATARSCVVAVDARREAGLGLTDQLSTIAPRLLNGARRWLTRHTRMTPSHIVTANVPGARGPRWFGDIEVVDWFSFAVAVAPVSVNLTVHSYDGRMNVGLVADPVALPDPHRFVERLGQELRVLADALLPMPVGAGPISDTDERGPTS
jgi:diacylglycerol O-acyltransferase